MITPTVTPITRRLEPVGRDPFVDDLRVVRDGGRHPRTGRAVADPPGDVAL